MAAEQRTWREFGQSTSFAFRYQILMIAPSIFLYHTFGLIASSLFTLASISALILFQKALGKEKTEPLMLAQLFLMTLFEVPPIILQNEYFLKLAEPISGLVMGFGYALAAIFLKEPMTKALIPADLRDGPKTSKFIKEFPNEPLKKIDYIWAAEMILSAAISLAVALIFPTSTWFYAKYIIGPTLSLIATGCCWCVLKPHIQAKPVFTQADIQENKSENTTPRILFHERAKPLIFTEYQSKSSGHLATDFDEFTSSYIHRPGLIN